MEQLQKQRQKTDKDESSAYLQDHPLDGAQTTADEEEIDDLLDAIDDVLEENAEDFIQGYIQAGGE